jgi:hypothetical protein
MLFLKNTTTKLIFYTTTTTVKQHSVILLLFFRIGKKKETTFASDLMISLKYWMGKATTLQLPWEELTRSHRDRTGWG